MKKLLSVLLVLALTVALLTACGSKTVESSSAAASSEAASSPEAASAAETTGEKTTIKFYGKCIEYTSGPKMTDALETALADKYNIESIQIDWSNMDTVIRTGLAGNEPCDVYNYPVSGMANYADMAVDLTPYLDADPEFKSYFSQSELDACTVDGKIVCLPWESNFTVILGNKEALEAAGVTVPESWTMDEFMAACKTIKDAGKFPWANATDLNRAGWLFRNAMLSLTLSDGKLADYQSGKLGWDSDECRTALEQVKALYDNGYLYPGEGAVTAKNDEIKAAFYQGDVLMMAEIAAGAKQTADGATDFTPVLVPWPSSGSKGAVNGGMNGLFIPKNSKNIDAAVEVLKTYLSPDIQAIHASEGYIPANVKVEVTDEFVKAVMAQAGTLTGEPVMSSATTDYISNNLTADLVLNGGADTVIQNLQAAQG